MRVHVGDLVLISHPHYGPRFPKIGVVLTCRPLEAHAPGDFECEVLKPDGRIGIYSSSVWPNWEVISDAGDTEDHTHRNVGP